MEEQLKQLQERVEQLEKRVKKLEDNRELGRRIGEIAESERRAAGDPSI